MSNQNPVPAKHGTIHASQAIPELLMLLYHALAKSDPELAEQFRHDPLGLKTGIEVFPCTKLKSCELDIKSSCDAFKATTTEAFTKQLVEIRELESVLSTEKCDHLFSDSIQIIC